MNGMWVLMSTDRLWTLQELADFLGVPTQSIYQMNWKGTGPRSYKVGRHRRYDPRDVRQWLETRSSDTGGGR
ncbi:helix-turn-helix domain-containing protein [Kitasatospora sp. NPDC088779]|uniref:helix-turn-helix transcriptional regulator n=1 Tax=Kitasatospora sp. NPDC088779 TaxID=3154964 RepID=UPI00344748FF